MNDTTLSNQIWENLLSYRQSISSLMSQSNPNAPNNLENSGYYTGYDSTQQDVIIGAFMCAYLGEKPTLNNINPSKSKNSSYQIGELLLMELAK